MPEILFDQLIYLRNVRSNNVHSNTVSTESLFIHPVPSWRLDRGSEAFHNKIQRVPGHR